MLTNVYFSIGIMDTITSKVLVGSILECTSENFTQRALEVFNFQYQNNKIYRAYCDILKTNPVAVNKLEKIPFLPIQFFKTKEIKTTEFEQVVIFESSGTSGSVNSKHFVKDLSVYEKSFITSFRQFYGDEKELCIIGLLPSYLERKGSSLVYMVDDLIKKSAHKSSGFYLYDHDQLKNVLLENEKNLQPTLLIGVTYALLDFAQQNKLQLKTTIVMETGGMKGRREEMTRKEVHNILKENLGISEVHSEYGMTELLSQAYSKGDGIFETPSWMRILIRKEDDPFDITTAEKCNEQFCTGAINIIDLANIFSCAFIATDDTGKLYGNNKFEVTGRLENSDMRGCGLMIL